MQPTPRYAVRFFDDQDQHAYTLDGVERPSVTTILKAEGLTDYDWCDEIHRNRGKAVHKIAQIISVGWHGSTVEEVVRNSRWDPAKSDPRIVGYGYAAAKYLLETGFRPELVEQPIGSQMFAFCGTLDAWGRLPDGRSLIPDYKSGEPQAAAWIQTGLYAHALEEWAGVKTDLRAPVWLMKDGSYKQLPPRPVAGHEDLAIGKCMVNLYHWRRRHKLLPKEDR